MLTRDEVIWAFRYCFGRDPESEETIVAHSAFNGWAQLREALVKTDEFVNNLPISGLGEHWVLAPVMSGTRLMWLDLGDRYVSRACLMDNYEPVESGFVRRTLKPDSIFLDIGANIGWFTMIGSTILGDKGHIHAFEPRPPTVSRLKRTIEANALGDRVTVHDFALSSSEGEGFISWARGTDNPGGSFISESELTGGMESERVPLRPLDSLNLGAVDFIKMDVEGSEMKVILGGERTFFSSRPVIMTEINPSALRNISNVSPNEFIDFFRERNYRVVMLEGREEFEIECFPPDWPRDIANVGMFPI
jgi:FkbM family methyltransferase